MIGRRHFLIGSTAVILAPFAAEAMGQEQPARVTILLDAFGKPSSLKRGWGYSAFIEHGGRRVLFDTGARNADFAHNVNALGVDLKRLDFVVLSHRHNDHTGGLHHVLRENPGVPIYTPLEGAAFNTQPPPGLMNLIKRYVEATPDEMRYFGGNPPAQMNPEAPWPGAQFRIVREQTDAFPGLTLFSTRSDVPGSREMNEIALLVKTSQGGVLFVGCSHPGIEKIVEAAAKIEPKLYAVFGGFHLVDIPDARVTEIVTGFKEKWGIQRMAAGHCTGQFAFAEMVRIYGDDFDRAGVGSVIRLPS